MTTSHDAADEDDIDEIEFARKRASQDNLVLQAQASPLKQVKARRELEQRLQVRQL